MSDLVFTVIDTACESADQSFFPPKVTLTTKSTTQIATLLGFSEFAGFESIPPKKYKTLTWDGTSEHQLWFPAGAPGNPGAAYQFAGARFDYSGASTIDSHGNYLSLYTKNFSSMCQATGNLVTTFLPGVNGGLENYVFVGWLGPTGHEKCALPGIPYTFVNNQAVGKGQVALDDDSKLWGSKKPQPLLSNAQISDFNAISPTQGVCFDSGGDSGTTVFIALFEPVPQGVQPPINNEDEGTVWFFAAPVWAHDYTATLTDEYTDVEALTNAQVIVGNGATAQNFPRTTGFVSTFTNVVFTLKLTNLIVGTAYTISVDLWNPGTGVTTTKQYGITATQTSQSITDIIPAPPPHQSIQVRNPRIAFT